jgi:hypothetical protein
LQHVATVLSLGLTQVKGAEADQPTLPLSLPGSAVHLVVDDTSLRLLEGVLRERLMV